MATSARDIWHVGWITCRMTPVAMILLLSVTLPFSPPNASQRPRASARPVMTMEVTAYCVEGETASGVQTRAGIVAADPAVLPLGSVIRVRGLRGLHNRTYQVEDTGRKIKGRIIDVFMANCQAAKRFGRQRARVTVVKRGAEPGR